MNPRPPVLPAHRTRPDRHVILIAGKDLHLPESGAPSVMADAPAVISRAPTVIAGATAVILSGAKDLHFPESCAAAAIAGAPVVTLTAAKDLRLSAGAAKRPHRPRPS